MMDRSAITLNMLGMERISVVTIRRSSGKADTSRSTRSSRARRATVASSPVLGSRLMTMMVKSKTFQPSAK